MMHFLNTSSSLYYHEPYHRHFRPSFQNFKNPKGQILLTRFASPFALKIFCGNDFCQVILQVQVLASLHTASPWREFRRPDLQARRRSSSAAPRWWPSALSEAATGVCCGRRGRGRPVRGSSHLQLLYFSLPVDFFFFAFSVYFSWVIMI